MCSPLKGFLLIVPLKATRDFTVCSLTPQCDAHHGALLRGWKHITELDSKVRCTLRSFLRNFDYLTHTADAASGVRPIRICRFFMLLGAHPHTDTNIR